MSDISKQMHDSHDELEAYEKPKSDEQSTTSGKQKKIGIGRGGRSRCLAT